MKDYKKQISKEIMNEVDSIFPANEANERDKALLLATALIVKVEKIVNNILEEEEIEDD